MTEPARRPILDGTRKVVRFNWPKYAAAGVVVLAARRRPARLPVVGLMLVHVAAAAATFWTATSLLATWWVYDHAGIYDLVGRGLAPVGRYASIHAGFDEATPSLARTLQHAPVIVVDLQVPPRGSLRRARSEPVSSPEGGPRLALCTASLDSVFMTFAVHEVRARQAQRALFDELHRVLVPGGRLVITEHLLDAANVGVFGPGALHFQPAATWMRRARESAFRLVSDDRLTPYVRRLVLQR